MTPTKHKISNFIESYLTTESHFTEGLMHQMEFLEKTTDQQKIDFKKIAVSLGFMYGDYIITDVFNKTEPVRMSKALIDSDLKLIRDFRLFLKNRTTVRDFFPTLDKMEKELNTLMENKKLAIQQL